jgi:hypothetical protein
MRVDRRLEGFFWNCRKLLVAAGLIGCDADLG